MTKYNCKLHQTYSDEEITTYSVHFIDDSHPFDGMEFSVWNDTDRADLCRKWCENGDVIVFEFWFCEDAPRG